MPGLPGSAPDMEVGGAGGGGGGGGGGRGDVMSPWLTPFFMMGTLAWKKILLREIHYHCYA